VEVETMATLRLARSAGRAGKEQRTRALPAVVVLVLLALLSGATAPARAARPLDPEDLALVLGGHDGRIMRPYGSLARPIQAGSWAIERGRLLPNGQLALVVKVQSPVPVLPVRAGPAVLFGSIALRADDSAAKAVVPDVAHAVARPCSPELPTCLRARIVLPTDRISEAAAGAPEVASWWAAVASLALVRTFAQGSWLQVLPLDTSVATWPAMISAEAGTLAQPRSFASPLRSFGLFTADQGRRWLRTSRAVAPDETVPMLRVVERIRANGAGDETELPLTYRLHLDVDPGDCGSWSIVSSAGDIAWDETGTSGRQTRSVHVPQETAWYLRSPSVSDPGARAPDIAHSFGPFTSRSSVLVMSGAWSCGARSGQARMDIRETGRRIVEPLSDCGRRLKVPVDICGR
jgi:hypothetical protein